MAATPSKETEEEKIIEIMAEAAAAAEEEIEKMEETKKNLCASVMKGDWDGVVKIYEEHPEQEVQGTRITLSWDTALHMAVYDDQEEILEKLIEATKSDLKQFSDYKKNTPLHLAAKMGNHRMCECIAQKQPDLIGQRNKDNETPLFLAALHGQQDAFITLCLICCCEEAGFEKIYEYGRRNSDGRTVLHCAIDGEYFNLAYEIINRFPGFPHSVDERGYTALHLLACKHTAFRSSSRFMWLQKIIYPAIPAEIPKMKDDPNLKILADRLPKKKDSSRSSGTGDLEAHPGSNAQSKKNAPSIFYTARRFIKHLFMKAIVLLVSGIWRTKDLFPKYIADMKEKHLWSIEIMNILLASASYYDYRDTGSEPTSQPRTDVTFDDHENMSDENNSDSSSQDNQKHKDGQVCSECHQKKKRKKSSHKNKRMKETPILIAAKNGINEIVSEVLEFFPVAIHDVNSDGKNLMLLAVENRQPHVYNLLLHHKKYPKNLLYHVDNEGNSALHLASKLEIYRPWLAPNAVLQMQWEIKWYEFIKESMPSHLLAHQNNNWQTPEEIFMDEHSDLVKNDLEWLMKTADSCTIVATLIATVAFATSASVPGGVSGRNGEPILKQQRMFEVFAISSLVALCFSLTAAIMFLSILTSRHQAMDFGIDLPRKLLIGLTSLFVSIVSMLVSFCGGHFFILRKVLRDAQVAEYLVVFVPVTIFTIMQFPLYFKLVLATIKKVPDRGFLLST